LVTSRDELAQRKPIAHTLLAALEFSPGKRYEASKMADSAISGLKLLSGAVGPVHISTIGATTGQALIFNGTNVAWATPGGAPSGAAGGDLTGTYPNPTVANDAITSAKIADGTITNADIVAAAGIPYSKLSLTNSIQNSDIVANAITTSKVANGTVTTSKMADSAISGLKLLTGAVGPIHINTSGAATGQALIFDGTNVAWATPSGGAPSGSAGGDLTGTYPNPTVANGAITSAKIADGTITNADIVAAAGIPYSKLSLTNSIQNFDIVANAVTTSKVANGTVTTSKMADSAISSLKLLTNAVGPVHLQSNAVLPRHINTSGATAGQSLVYNGSSVAWGTPTASAGGMVVYTGVSGGTISQTLSDLTVRTVLVGFGGSTGGSSTINITIPSAASYPAGTILTFSATAYITANPTWVITSSGSSYYALNFNGSSMSSLSLGAATGIRMVSDGVSSWYKVVTQ